MTQKLHAAINAVMSECKYIQNDTTIQLNKTSSFKSISSEKVKEVIQPLLVKHGLTVAPVNIEPIIERDNWEETDNYGNKKIKFQVVMNLIVTFQVTHCESGESLLMQSIGTGVDNGDKAPGKAMTYAEKNLFLNLFVIPTGEDRDDYGTESPSVEQKPKLAPGTDKWPLAIKALKAGKTTLEEIAARYDITSSDLVELQKQSA